MNSPDRRHAATTESPSSEYPERLDPNALLAQMGGEVARALSSALERVSTLAASGQIDREGLRVLREEIDLARRVGIMGQQLVRLDQGDVKATHERVDLTALLREALQLRQRESRSRSIEVRHSFVDVAMVGNPALTFSLIETLLDWSFEHARQRLVFKLESKQNPTRARLRCAFLRRPVEGGSTLDAEAHRDPALSTMSWRLLKQTARVLGLQLRRRDTADRCELRLSFLGADSAHFSTLPGLEASEISELPMPHVAPLAGRHLVVLSSRREVRGLVRDALRASGSMIDFVATVEEAKRLFEDALPHAIIYEAALGGDRFERLRQSLLLEAPNLAFVEIGEEGRDFEVRDADGHPYASVGRDGLLETLPEAVLFELSRQN
jgi:hypothetical protein